MVSTIRIPEGSEFLVMIGVFVFAEFLFFARLGVLGLIVYGTAMATLYVLLYVNSGSMVPLYQSILLVPVLRIFTFGIPPVVEGFLLELGVIYFILLISTLVVVRSQGLSSRTLGFSKDGIPLCVLGIGAGVVLGAVQYGLDLEEFAFSPTIVNVVLIVLVAGLLVGTVEELIFRGLIQRWAAEPFNEWIAIFGTSVLFGAMHAVWLNPLTMIFAGGVSLFLGWSYVRTNNMWFIITTHGMINVTAFLILPTVYPEWNGQLLRIL